MKFWKHLLFSPLVMEIHPGLSCFELFSSLAFSGFEAIQLISLFCRTKRWIPKSDEKAILVGGTSRLLFFYFWRTDIKCLQHHELFVGLQLKKIRSSIPFVRLPSRRSTFARFPRNERADNIFRQILK